MSAAAPPQLIPAEQEARLIALLRGQFVDAAGLAQLAPRSGVAGPVAHILGDSNTLAIQELAHERGLYWLRRIGQALDSANVPFLILKGIPLGERYYRPHYLRACGDLDVLIDPADFARADKAIRPCGYLPSAIVPVLTSRMIGHHVHYEHPSAPSLEIHFLLQSFFGSRPAARPFLDRSISQTLTNGYSVRVLNPVDEFVHLAAHAAVHRWVECRWVYDLVLLLERHPALDWNAVAMRTGELRLWPSVLFTCVVLEQEWATPVPLAAMVPALYERARLLLPSTRREVWEGSNMAKLALMFRELAFCQGIPEKFRFVMRVLTYPVIRRVRDRLG